MNSADLKQWIYNKTFSELIWHFMTFGCSTVIFENSIQLINKKATTSPCISWKKISWMRRTFCICDYQLQRDIRIFPFTVNLSNMLQNLRYYLLKFVWSCKRKLLFCSIQKRQKMQQQLRLNNFTIYNSLKNSLITTLKIRSEMNGTKDTNTESEFFDQIFRASWKFRDLLYKIH